jgi:hypothetical protein
VNPVLTSSQNATQATTTGTPALISYQPPGATSTEGSPVGSGTGAIPSYANGTLTTPTLSSPTESVVPFTGGALGQTYERMMMGLVVAVGSAFLLI